MSIKHSGMHIRFNSPAVLGFVLACFAVRLLDIVTAGLANDYVFSVYRGSLTDPLTYLRCLTHVFGHADMSHLLNNMMYILILGPMLEEKYGTVTLLEIMGITAVTTGVIVQLFFPHMMLLGASGIVFSMILLSSITSVGEHEIPLTFILVAVLYLGNQVYEGLFSADNISQLGHIIGGVVGSALGFLLNRR